MRRAQTRLQRFRAAAVRGAVRIAKFGAAVTAVAATALVLLVRRTAQAVDQTTKLSRALGITFNTLTAYKLAASEAGIEQKQLETSLKKMIKAVSDANNGLSTAVRAFAQFGLTSKDLIDLKPDQIFERIADEVKRTGESVKTTGAIMDIFGARVGVSLLPLLMQGSGVLKEATKEIERLGVGMTQLQTRKIEEMNDALGRAKLVFVGLAQQLTAELAPAITQLSKDFTAWATEGEGAGAKIITVIDNINAAFAVTRKIIDGIVLAAQTFAKFSPVFIAGKLLSKPGGAIDRSVFNAAHRARADKGFSDETIGTLRVQRAATTAQRDALSPEAQSAAFLERILANIEGDGVRAKVAFE